MRALDTPKFNKSFAMKQEVEQETLLKLGTLKKIDYCKWGTPIALILKIDGSVRISGNYMISSNSGLEIDQYPLSRTDKLFTT